MLYLIEFMALLAV